MKKILLILLLVIICAIDSCLIEPNLLIEKNKTLYLPNWDKRLDGLKIAVLSDFHMGAKNTGLDKVQKIVDRINDKNPDLIFLLGDYEAVSISKNFSTKEVSDILKKFKAKYGVISILGNHDYYPQKIVKKCLDDSKIPYLEDETKVLKINGAKLKIAGVKDYWYYPESDPKKVIGKEDIPTILLVHNPDWFKKAPDKISLTLSGHTHGGDIIFPITGSPFVPSEFGQKYNKGYIIENGRHLFVTSGITTTSGYRFLNPPEIVFLTLFSETKPQKDTKPKKGFSKNYNLLYLKLKTKLFKR